VAFVFQPKELRQSYESPIQVYVAKSDVFGKEVDKLIQLSQVFDDPCADLSYKLSTMKQIFVLASRNALDELGLRARRPPADQLMLWTSMLRAFWYKRAAVAEKCLASDPRLSEYFSIDTRGEIFLTLPQEFLAKYEVLQRTDIARLQDDFDNAPRPTEKKNFNRSQQLHRWSQLWLPFRKKLVLGCLVVPASVSAPVISEITSPFEMASHIGAHWGSSFNFMPRSLVVM